MDESTALNELLKLKNSKCDRPTTAKRCKLDTDGDENTSALKIQDINPIVNANAMVHGYFVEPEVYILKKIKLNMSVADFGLNILLIFFAKYYARGQYPLFVNTFQCIDELEIIERMLLEYNQHHIKLPLNLATHPQYGLKVCNYKGDKYLTIENFNRILLLMRSPTITAELFVGYMHELNIHIVETLYIITSITKECKLIKECHELMFSSLNYTIPKPVKTQLTLNAIYWFRLPKNSIWFAYHNKFSKFSTYVSLETTSLLEVFTKPELNLNCLVVGVIANSIVYPLFFEHPQMLGNWDETVKFIKMANFNNLYMPVIDPTTGADTLQEAISKKSNSFIYFVRTNLNTLFKYSKM